MEKKIHIAFFLFLIASIAVIKLVISDSQPLSGVEAKLDDPDTIPMIEWLTLNDFDYKTGEGPKELTELDGKLVKIPGFVVPLSHDYSKLDHFLLVPDAQACIHVPPPPPNLIVTVTLRKPLPADKVYNPSWVIGIFKIEKSMSKHGGSAFKLDGIRMFKFAGY